MSHLRPAAPLPPRGADQVEGRVLRVDRDGLLVDWGGRFGQLRHPWSEAGARFVRVPRLARGGGRRSELRRITIRRYHRRVSWVMSITDELVRNNEAYTFRYRERNLRAAPRRGVAVLACMDARIDVHRVLGLAEGDAHVIRNAGGQATDDAIRSLAISQRRMGTTEIILMNHTDCGMVGFTEAQMSREVLTETGRDRRSAGARWPA